MRYRIKKTGVWKNRRSATELDNYLEQIKTWEDHQYDPAYWTHLPPHEGHIDPGSFFQLMIKFFGATIFLILIYQFYLFIRHLF